MQPILTLNGGSSSLKFALFDSAEALKRVLTGQIKHLGTPDAALDLTDQITNQTVHQKVSDTSHDFIQLLSPFLEKYVKFDQIAAVGHRIVHGGMKYSAPEMVTPEMLDYLDQISAYDPEHLPLEVNMMRTIAQKYTNVRQIACFDTAFHQDMPQVARLLPIPRRYFNQGIRRYGFHGLSYACLMDELRQRIGESAANSKVILAHLGSGASMAAVLNGKSIDTTMAFTPTAGLVMSSRTGDLDPGLAGFLAKTEQMTPEQFSHMANFESGLLGVSETSADMSELLKHEKDDPRAADAINLFCYTARKFIGAYAAALGGLDALVFAGGIGENSAAIRARICQNLDFLGILLAADRNEANAPIISAETSRVSVHVIKTDEELQIARSVKGFLS